MTAAWRGGASDGGAGPRGRGAGVARVDGSSTRLMTWITDTAAGWSALMTVAGSVLPLPLTVIIGASAVPAGGVRAQGRAFEARK